MSDGLIDPFAEKKRPWGWYLLIVIVVLLALSWVFGKFDRALSAISPKITSSWVFHQQPSPSPEEAARQNMPPAQQKK